MQTIPKKTVHLGTEGADQAATYALGALGWLLSDGARADRFLALTGLSPESLRESLDSPATLRAVLDFLCAHEPDLVAAADELGITPARLAMAAEDLAA